jgi:hypothetical protein
MALLTELKENLRKELPASGFLAPDGVDQERGQVAKGDHHEGMPFAFMDFPRYFHREDMFTYRVFFWWGHPVVFSMILKGPLLKDYYGRLKDHVTTLSGKGFHIALAKDPWDWHPGTPHTMEITAQNQQAVLDQMAARDYLKIERFMDLEPLETFEERLLVTGKNTFQSLLPIIAKTPPRERRVYLLCPNLFWASRVLEAGTHAGVSVQRFDRLDDVARAMTTSSPVDLIVLDIDALKTNGMDGIADLRRTLPDKTLLWGVGSHVDTVSREKAEALGCHKVWVRSEFTRRVGELLLGG